MSTQMSIIQLATIFFIVTNPIGNSPVIISLIKDHPLKRQQQILFRESIFSMILALFFLFMGEIFLRCLKIAPYALSLSGGTLLFLVALKMIFSVQDDTHSDGPKQDPFIVPIATPLLSGAGLLTMIMVYSKQEANDFKIFLAILVAWAGVTAVLVTAPYLQLFFGKRGMAAMEQLMGMLLALMAMQMIVNGSALFIKALSALSSGA